MSDKVDLPSGGWALLRDPDTVRNRDRKEILRRVEGLDDNAGNITIAMSSVEFGLALMVEEWSFDELALPRDDLETLDDLTIEDFDALAQAIEPLMRKVFPSFDPSPDPASPTEPSSE